MVVLKGMGLESDQEIVQMIAVDSKNIELLGPSIQVSIGSPLPHVIGCFDTVCLERCQKTPRRRKGALAAPLFGQRGPILNRSPAV